jgi:hypothetical protein
MGDKVKAQKSKVKTGRVSDFVRMQWEKSHLQGANFIGDYPTNLTWRLTLCSSALKEKKS